MTSLTRSTRTMAVGTLASRGTGFVRTAALAAALGAHGASIAYNLANTAPNTVYDLLLGGVLTSVVVPLLVRAAKQDGDGGAAYAQRLLSLTVLALGAASVLLVVLAPQIVDLYLAPGAPAGTRELAVAFARFFLPQVLFYGAGAVLGGILNTRGSFAAPMWAPVLNNVVVIGTAAVFLLLPATTDPTRSLTHVQVLVLGIGTTLGVIAQTVALVPALRASGFRLRVRLDLRGTGLGHAARLAKWVFLYVVANQIAYLVVVRLSSGLPDGRGYAVYVYAYVLFQLPYAVVAVSVISALLPTMSRAAADERYGDLRGQLSTGMRLVSAVLVPAVAAYVVLGPAVATLVLGHGRLSVDDARYIGQTLGVLSLGLLPFSAFQLQLRAFYALDDTRTPTLVNVGATAVNLALDLLAVLVLPPDQQVLGLAGAYAASYAVGLVLSSRLLARRLGGLDGARVLRTAVRCVAAVLVPALLALTAQLAVTALLGRGTGAAVAALLTGGALLAVGYLIGVRCLRVREVDEVVGPLLRRVGLGPRLKPG
jgi:putative peptidoglycan lipid II flippase